jgi:hypothetical protein
MFVRAKFSRFCCGRCGNQNDTKRCVHTFSKTSLLPLSRPMSGEIPLRQSAVNDDVRCRPRKKRQNGRGNSEHARPIASAVSGPTTVRFGEHRDFPKEAGLRDRTSARKSSRSFFSARTGPSRGVLPQRGPRPSPGHTSKLVRSDLQREVREQRRFSTYLFRRRT